MGGVVEYRHLRGVLFDPTGGLREQVNTSSNTPQYTRKKLQSQSKSRDRLNFSVNCPSPVNLRCGNQAQERCRTTIVSSKKENVLASVTSVTAGTEILAARFVCTRCRPPRRVDKPAYCCRSSIGLATSPARQLRKRTPIPRQGSGQIFRGRHLGRNRVRGWWRPQPFSSICFSRRYVREVEIRGGVRRV